MANILFDNPPVLTGNEQNQVQQLQRYLYTISQQLNEALRDISIEQLNTKDQETIRQLQEKTEKAETGRTGLKELIIKNAEITRTEEDEIRTQLTRNVTALSESFGEFRQNITADLVATALGIMQKYEALETIVNTANGGSEEFQTRISSYIFSGVLDPNTNPPTTGIAIGENVTNSDGTLNGANKKATFTANRITFYNNNVEIGYYEGNEFHISKGEVSDAMKIGNFIFKRFADGSMGLMKE